METDSRTRILTLKHLRVEKGITASNATLIRWERDDAFPRRSYLGARMAFWLEAEIDDFIMRRKSETQSGPNSVLTASATEASQTPKAKRRRHLTRLKKTEQRKAAIESK